jgi:hypothetical protein
LAPVIETNCYGSDEIRAFRLTVSGVAPAGVIDSVTRFTFEARTVPPKGEPYDVRFFFEHVEWKDVRSGWEWTDDWIWDDFVAEWASGEWPKPIEFLGVARQVDGPPSDPIIREWPSPSAKFIGGFYRLDFVSQ